MPKEQDRPGLVDASESRTGLNLSMPLGKDRPGLVKTPESQKGLDLPMLLGKGMPGLVNAWVAIKRKNLCCYPGLVNAHWAGQA